MPELPEVETVVRQLAPLVVGRSVRRLEIFDPKLQVAHADADAVAGRMIKRVERLGKQILIHLTDKKKSADPLWLCVHLRMTGRLIWSLAPGPVRPPLRARLRLDKGYILFKDARRFGTLRLLDSLERAHPGGLEPLSEAFTSATLAALLAGSRQEIKPWLLRQDRLVGLGNIYASESLFDARLSPHRLAGSLTREEIGRLRRAILSILRRGIAHGGTTIADFENARGKSGGFQKMLKVYARTGQPCRRCGAIIRRFVQQGRGTFDCPHCQKEKP